MHIREPKYQLKKNLLPFLFIVDVILLTICYLGSYLLRFDLKLPSRQYLVFRNTLIPILVLKISAFYYCGLYRGVWRYTSLKDLENIIKATFASSFFIVAFVLITQRFQGIVFSIFFIDYMFTIILIGGFRLALRITVMHRKQRDFTLGKQGLHFKKKKKVLIIGAGDAGERILREIKGNLRLGYEVVGFLDDDPTKNHRSIHGVKVLGSIREITSVSKSRELDEIIIAIPSASEKVIRSIVNLCRQTGVNCKTIPGVGELINGKVSTSIIRDISYTDLLGRTQVEMDIENIGTYLREKCVLVTGAGGSIGSECCRQIAKFRPETLIMLDRAESSLYDIEMEMKHLFPKQRIVPILGSVTCSSRLDTIFNKLKPQVVFHAAAYKHVPMLEMHPWEAIYNNILGTKNVLDMAVDTNVERFVLISTDKAVRPTNIMGATKRVTEIILQLKHKEIERLHVQGKHGTKMVMAVRFGNVIGSAGSVIPLFKKQIARGGPITITHPEVIRYFMTINEAVQLVLQAGAMGKGGEIFILKMGKPIKIIDMAGDLIRLSGFEPEKDIPIKVIGLRPGEKLYEELITEGEGIVSTLHEKLMVLRGNGCNGMVYSNLEAKIKKLLVLARENDSLGIKSELKRIVPEYNPQELLEPAKYEPKEITIKGRMRYERVLASPQL